MDILVNDRVCATKTQIVTPTVKTVIDHDQAGVGGFDPFNFSLLEGYASSTIQFEERMPQTEHGGTRRLATSHRCSFWMTGSLLSRMRNW